MSPVLDSIGSVKAYGWGSFSLPPAFESIATVTATTSTTNIAFNSIPNTYQHLQVRWLAKCTDSVNQDASWVYFTVNGSSGYLHNIFANGTVQFSEALNISGFYGGMIPNSHSSQTNMWGVGILDIHDYASTNKNKTMRVFAGNDTNGNPQGIVSLISGLYSSTNAITSLSFNIQNNSKQFVSGSTFALYGIKGV